MLTNQLSVGKSDETLDSADTVLDRLSNCVKTENKVGTLVVSEHLIEEVLTEQQWSPEQISLWLKKEDTLEISHGRTYQNIILDKQTGGDLHAHLRARKKRRKCYGGGTDRRGCTPNQVSIENRPAEAEAWDRPGAD